MSEAKESILAAFCSGPLQAHVSLIKFKVFLVLAGLPHLLCPVHVWLSDNGQQPRAQPRLPLVAPLLGQEEGGCTSVKVVRLDFCISLSESFMFNFGPDEFRVTFHSNFQVFLKFPTSLQRKYCEVLERRAYLK